jgi:tetrahydromethanopterin S-methyltransferase subunit G
LEALLDRLDEMEAERAAMEAEVEQGFKKKRGRGGNN